jgi:flagellar motor switch protein FliG
MSGPLKTAILFVALGQAEAARMMQNLTAREVELVVRELAVLGPVDPETVESVVQEFEQISREIVTTVQGGAEFAQQVLVQALGPAKSAPILDRVLGESLGTGFRRLKRAAPEALAEVLRNEHPQTMALILANIDTRQATRVIEAMPVGPAAEVLYRMARMEKVAPDVMTMIENTLSNRTDLAFTQHSAPAGGPKAVAKVLNMASSGIEKSLYEGLEQRNAEIAQKVKSLMFVFEDLTLIDGKGMQRLLREISNHDLALALKVASDEVKAHIRSNMAERAAAAMDEEIEMLGPVRLRDVEAVHATIIETVRTLEAANEIMVRSRDGNDDIVD